MIRPIIPQSPKKTIVKFYVSEARYSWLWTRMFPGDTVEQEYIIVEGYHAGAELWIMPQPADSGNNKVDAAAISSAAPDTSGFAGCDPPMAMGAAVLWPLGPQSTQIEDEPNWYDNDDRID